MTVAASNILQILHDTNEEYHLEMVPILFYPAGFRYRARYKRKHTESGILSGASDYAGKAAIVCLRYKPNGDKWPEAEMAPEFAAKWRAEPRIVPARYVTIDSIVESGEIVIVTYTFSEYYAHPTLPIAERIAKSLQFNAALKGVNGSSADSSALLATVNASLLSDYEDKALSPDQRWQNFVGLMSVVSSLRNTPFVRLQQPHKITSSIRGATEHVPVPLFGESRSLLLDPGHTYSITFFDAFPSEFAKDPQMPRMMNHRRRYTLRTDASLSIASTEQLAIGGYDFFRFVVQVRDAAEGRCGELLLVRSQPAGGDGQDVDILEFPVEYTVRSNAQSSRVNALLFGATLFLERVLVSTQVAQWLVQKLASALAVEASASDAFVQRARQIISDSWAQFALVALDGILMVLFIGFMTEYLISKRRHKET